MSQIADAQTQNRSWEKWVILGLTIFSFIVPYGLGRHIGFTIGKQVLTHFDMPLRVFAVVGWLIFAITSFFVMYTIVAGRRKPSLKYFSFLGINLILLLFGFTFFRLKFWNATYSMYGKQAPKADAIIYGLLFALLAFFVHLLILLISLIFLRKDSPIRKWVLTPSGVVIIECATYAIALMRILTLPALGA